MKTRNHTAAAMVKLPKTTKMRDRRLRRPKDTRRKSEMFS